MMAYTNRFHNLCYKQYNLAYNELIESIGISLYYNNVSTGYYSFLFHSDTCIIYMSAINSEFSTCIQREVSS